MSTPEPTSAVIPPRWLPAPVADALARRPMLGRLLGNVGWLVLERVAPLATAFVVNAIVVRHLGPTQYGLFSYALSFAALFSTLASLGTETIAVRDLTRSPEGEGEILGTALGLRLGAAVLLWALAVVAVFQLRADRLARTLVAILAVQAFATAIMIFEAWFQARIAARSMVVARTSVALAAQVARVLLVVAAAALPAFAAVTTCAALLSAGLVALLWRRAARDRLSWSWGRARQLARDSWPLVIQNISIMVYMKIDQVMLTSMAGPRENGIYATAVTLSELWYFLPMAIAATVFPLIVKAHDTETEAEFQQTVQLFYDAMAAVGWTIALCVFAFAGTLVSVLYGGAFAESASVLRVHVASLVFICIGVARAQFLLAKGYNRFLMMASVLAAVINVGLNLVLIPRWGALGAAWSTLVSYVAANYFTGLLSPKLWTQTWMLTKSLAVPLRPGLLWRRARGRAAHAS